MKRLSGKEIGTIAVIIGIIMVICLARVKEIVTDDKDNPEPCEFGESINNIPNPEPAENDSLDMCEPDSLKIIDLGFMSNQRVIEIKETGLYRIDFNFTMTFIKIGPANRAFVDNLEAR